MYGRKKYWTLSETHLCQLFQVGQDGLSEAEVEKIRSKERRKCLAGKKAKSYLASVL